MIDRDTDYVLEGRMILRLLRIAERFNDGTVMSANERRDLAQELRAKLETACPLPG